MICWGTGKDGSLMLLGKPREMVLSFDREAPADGLKAVFPAEEMWEALSRVEVIAGGHVVFRGVVDEQNTKIGPEGLWVELVCRSMEALLLDNEACPQTVQSPSLKLLEAKLLAPLGFQKVDGPQEAVPGGLEIEKGASCWQVLADFCGRHFGAVPYVDGEGVLRCGGGETEEVSIEEVLRAEISQKPCKELSEIWQQSFRGTYDTPYRDREAVSLRRRYVSSQSGGDPKKMLKEAKKESWSAAVECGGAVWPLRGKTVSVSLPGLGRLSGCGIKSGRCFLDSQGLRTRLVLEKGESTCG